MEQNITPQGTTPSLPPSQSGFNRLMQRVKEMIGVKSAIIIFCILIILGLAYFFKSILLAASVDGDVIGRMSVISRLESTAGAQVLDTMITESLISAEAKRKGIVVTDEELNAEIAKLDEQFTAQNTTLDEALAASNLTREKLKEQLVIQKQIEKILGDTVNVSDEEVTKYITDNKLTLPKEQAESARAQIMEQLKSEKINLQVDALLATLKGKANIKHYVNY